MKKIFITTLFIFIITVGYSQKSNTKTTIVIPSISNLKLGLDDEEIIKKYGPASGDTINNSTRILVYDHIKLDNNYVLNSISFRFFNKKLFQIFFKLDDDIHIGLSAKYGYEDIGETTGIYGNFRRDIVFFRVKMNDNYYVTLENEQISKLSESEGF